MKITKLGHCCLIIEEKGLKILTDPGNYTHKQNEVTGIDIVLISHEHSDHYHLDSVKALMKNNPTARLISNGAVGSLLEKEGFKYEKVGDGEKIEIGGVLIEGFGKDHAPIYKDLMLVENTGYLINSYLYIPGDAFHAPSKGVLVLALPVAGPWVKISDSIDYALEVKPKKTFPVHDANLRILGGAPYYVSKEILEKNNIEFLPLELDKPTEI
ncbi:MAG TPA: MBL fold metallo-hydrolase [Candidatus Paceibacterota bacterium]|nr:MBL fold metallo-hydrolase [Candidatus Paceibacterota bacterium]